MINHITVIDNVGLQVNCFSPQHQEKTRFALFEHLKQIEGCYINHTDFTDASVQKMIRRVYFLYYKGKRIASFSTGMYVGGTGHIYFISITFAGLKQYNPDVDRMAQNILFSLAGFLNHNDLEFKITKLDICMDIESPLDNVLSLCVRKTARMQYYAPDASQSFQDTTYIEQIVAKEKYKPSVRSYMYNKTAKHNLDHTLTRFEIKLQPRYLRSHGADIEAIGRTLERYYVLYFEEYEQKEMAESVYTHAMDSQYARKKFREQYSEYQIYPDLEYIDFFIYSLMHMYFVHPEHLQTLALYPDTGLV